MKLAEKPESKPIYNPAAFGRLCVETIELELIDDFGMPAAFGRLCVETSQGTVIKEIDKPAAFGRLCVETDDILHNLTLYFQPPSGGCVLKQLGMTSEEIVERPAAFGRLCVETSCVIRLPTALLAQPPSGGCVLKRLWI